jgi:O-antigen ligase
LNVRAERQPRFTRALPAKVGVLLTLSLVPVWLRLPDAPFSLAPLYAVHSVTFLAALFTLTAWLLCGCPGLAALRRDHLGAIWALLLLTLALWAFTSTGWAFASARRPDVALNAALAHAVAALFALVVACVGPSPRHIALALLAGLAWNTALIGVQVALQGEAGLALLGEFRIDPARSGVSVVTSGDTRWLRPYGLLPHPNILGGYLAVALLAGVYNLLALGRRAAWAVGALLLAGLWAFWLTFSRGAWVGFAGGALALLPLLLRLRVARARLWLTLALALLLAVGFFVLYRDLLFARAGLALQSTEVFSVAERGSLLVAGYEAIRVAPLFGTGAGSAPWWAADYLFRTGSAVRGNYAHQLWVAAWSDLGIIGLALFAGASGVGVERALLAIRRRGGDSLARAVLLAGFIALSTAGLFDYYAWSIFQFQILWWSLLAAALRPTPPAPRTGVA